MEEKKGPKGVVAQDSAGIGLTLLGVANNATVAKITNLTNVTINYMIVATIIAKIVIIVNAIIKISIHIVTNAIITAKINTIIAVGRTPAPLWRGNAES